MPAVNQPGCQSNRSAGQKRPGDLSRLIAQGLRSSETPPKKGGLESQKQYPLRRLCGSPPSEGSGPMLSSEPAPSSPRPWASAWRRPLADDSTLTPAFVRSGEKGTFLLCWKRGHFYFALTPVVSSLDFLVPEDRIVQSLP